MAEALALAESLCPPAETRAKDADAVADKWLTLGKHLDSEQIEAAPAPDDAISRLDLVRWLEAEIAATKRRMNPEGAFYHQDTARLSSLQAFLRYVEDMEGQ